MSRRAELRARFERVRAGTLRLTAPLDHDDQLAQAFEDASPTKWHLGHTTWFFDRFVPIGGSRPDPKLEYVFNSYYEGIGPRQPRAQRSLITRPTLPEVLAYRERIEARVRGFFDGASEAAFSELAFAIELGIHHEEQHQELILTDIKPVLAGSVTRPAYVSQIRSAQVAPSLGFRAFEGGLVEIGHQGDEFAFDNETPRHRVWLEAFELATRCVTAREYLAFMEDGGYSSPLLWLSDGWASVKKGDWSAPMYWSRTHDGWMEHTMAGLQSIDLEAPVCHVSSYEADAFARWAAAQWRGARLPTEAEWELAAAEQVIEGNFVESGRLHPAPAPTSSERASGAPAPSSGPASSVPIAQLFGDVWEWTGSAYMPYPRHRSWSGEFAEYNGKFMCNQLVLRGGSCFSPRDHLRASYRNFFPPGARWQMSGLRLARWPDATS